MGGGITYLPMARGFLYLVAIMDWHSRTWWLWGLSSTRLETGFCAEALTEALGQDEARRVQQSTREEFTSREFTQIPPGSLGEDQHGWQGQVPGQHTCRAAMEDSEVRGGLPEGLRQRP